MGKNTNVTCHSMYEIRQNSNLIWSTINTDGSKMDAGYKWKNTLAYVKKSCKQQNPYLFWWHRLSVMSYLEIDELHIL